VTLVSPFDSLIWERTRMRRIFGVTMLLEAYRPKAERVHGYFAMPLLADGALVGLVDPVGLEYTIGTVTCVFSCQREVVMRRSGTRG
jgi:hypothetical protein